MGEKEPPGPDILAGPGEQMMAGLAGSLLEAAGRFGSGPDETMRFMPQRFGAADDEGGLTGAFAAQAMIDRQDVKRASGPPRRPAARRQQEG